MKKEEFNSKLQEIGTLEDLADVRVKLAELSDEMNVSFDTATKLEEDNSKLISENEKLRSANMELFLRVGSNKSDEEIKEEKLGKEETDPEPRKFENLFDEAGNLKK